MGESGARRAAEGPKLQKGAFGGHLGAQKGTKSQKTANFRLFFGIIGKVGPPDSVLVHFLAKDAEGAKKPLRCPKPLGELGALCENISPGMHPIAPIF